VFSRFLWNKTGFILAGLTIFIFGLVLACQPSPECDGQQMTSEQLCSTRRAGRTHTQTFDEAKRGQSIMIIGFLIGGTAMITGGIAWTVKDRRRHQQ
jgi:hypothetical protein